MQPRDGCRHVDSYLIEWKSTVRVSPNGEVTIHEMRVAIYNKFATHIPSHMYDAAFQIL